MRNLLRAARRLMPSAMAVSLVVAPMLVLAPSVAAATPNGGAQPAHATLTRQVAISTAECAVMARAAGAAAPSSTRAATCAAVLRLTVDAVPVRTRPLSTGLSNDQAAASSTGCTTTWVIRSLTATVQSLFWGVFWSATANATGYGDSCGRVMWTSVTCDSHGIGYTVTTGWCGAYPRTWAWYGYTSTNMGLNITVSAVTNGTPVSFTHGARNGFNPYTGTQYGFFAW